MRIFSFICVVALTFSFQHGAVAQMLGEIYNTGTSLVEEANGASLNIRFNPCADNKNLVCAKVIDVIEPNGPSGQSVLPDGSDIIGYVMIRNLKPRKNGRYRRGRIASLDESMVKGKMLWYGVKIDDNFDGTLTVKGCLGPICPRTMVWKKVAAQ